MVVSDARKALDALKQGGFALGAGFDRAHAIAQANEGQALYDWIHALCHRIEGDQGNAAYWYRRAGQEPFDGSFAAEHDAIVALIDDETP